MFKERFSSPSSATIEDCNITKYGGFLVTEVIVCDIKIDTDGVGVGGESDGGEDLLKMSGDILVALVANESETTTSANREEKNMRTWKKLEFQHFQQCQLCIFDQSSSKSFINSRKNLLRGSREYKTISISTHNFKCLNLLAV